MGRRMTLKGQISLCLAAFFLALAGQIFLSFYQSGTVLRELDDQMGNFNAISRFQNGVERSLSAMEDYRWEYGDAKALTEELHSAFSVTNAWLWRIESDLGTVSEEQYLLYNAVSTTYDSYTALVDQLEEAVARRHTHLGILATGKDMAQQVCEQMAAAGIHGIWNVSGQRVTAPQGVLVQSETFGEHEDIRGNENFVLSLVVLAKHLGQRMGW